MIISIIVIVITVIKKPTKKYDILASRTVILIDATESMKSFIEPAKNVIKMMEMRVNTVLGAHGI